MTARNFIKPIFAVAASAMFALACNQSNSDKEKNITSKDPPAETEARPEKVKKAKASVGNMTTENSTVIKDKNGVYNKPEVMPEFHGGESALAEYISNNIKYDSQSQQGNSEGTVVVSFVIDEKGNVENAKAENSTTNNEGLNKEAVRVIKGMPDWKPGTIKGKAVKTRMYLPVTFKMYE